MRWASLLDSIKTVRLGTRRSRAPTLKVTRAARGAAPTSRLLRLAGGEIRERIRHPLALVDAQFRKDGDT